MKILGIDPGRRTIGYGVIEKRPDTLELLEYGVIETNPRRSTQENLIELQKKLENILNRHSPRLAGVEKLFFAKNLKTAIGVSEARGVILLTLQKYKAQIFEFSPREVKRAVTGDGAADKKQVAKMTKLILRLNEEPKPDDAADALAIAICAANQRTYQQ